MITLRSVFTRDAPLDYLGRVRSRDTLLDVVPSGKIAALGTVWTGKLQPKIDEFISKATDFITPFFPTRVLNAEPFPPDMAWQPAQRWLGDLTVELRDEFQAAIAASRPAAGDWNQRVDLSEIHEAVENFRRSVGSPVDQNDTSQFQEKLRRMSDGIVRIRDAAQRVSDQVRAKSTTDAGNVLRRWAQASGAAAAKMNVDNKRFWEARSGAPTQDSAGGATEVRDRLADVNRARSEFERLREMNRLNRAHAATRYGER